MKNLFNKIIILAIFSAGFFLQSCGRKGPLKLPNNETSTWNKEDKDMYE